MTGGEAYRAKLLADNALDAPISAYLANSSKPVVLKIGQVHFYVMAASFAGPRPLTYDI
ncbi:hypothetical protein [Methylobacterium tarhaniae]|uniref:hypothetical protein n=1 Tax=Methylobacterium tarhaniae TaxID=1187852 RepID=UPI003CFCBE5D